MFKAAEREVFAKYGIPPEIGLMIIREVHRAEFESTLQCVKKLEEHLWMKDIKVFGGYRYIHFELELIDDGHCCTAYCRKGFSRYLTFVNGMCEYERRSLRFWSCEYRRERKGKRKLSYVPLK